MYQGSPLFRSFTHSRGASTVILRCSRPPSHHSSSLTSVSLVRVIHLLPPSTPFWPYGSHPFFPHAQTISILSDLLYSLTHFLFQLSYIYLIRMCQCGLPACFGRSSPPRCRTSQDRRTFIALSVSPWNDLGDHAFDVVGLAITRAGKNKVKSPMASQEPPSGESATTECGVNYQLYTCSNVLK